MKSDTNEDVDEKKVDVAVRFLSNPNVKSTKKESKEAFLKSKGLSDIEIVEAMKKASFESEAIENNKWSLFTYFKGIVLGAGILSAANYAYKAYILPYVAHEIKDDGRIERLGESVQALKDDIKQHTYELSSTLKDIQMLLEKQHKVVTLLHESIQNSSLAHPFLADIKTELSNVKTMMLSRQQFPKVPFSQQTTEIPAWQRLDNKKITDESRDNTEVVKTILEEQNEVK